MYVGIISALFASVTGTYFVGVSAGKDTARLEHNIALNETYRDYNARLDVQVKQYNSEVRANRAAYENELDARFNEAKLLASEEAIAANVTVEIRERIKYVESECSNVGNDAYGLYQRTRGIISDPRVTEVDTTSITSALQSKPASTLLQRPEAYRRNY